MISTDLVFGYYVTTELAQVSREHLSKIVEPFTGTMGSASFYMSSALYSDSGAVGTARSDSQQTLGQMLHADHAASSCMIALRSTIMHMSLVENTAGPWFKLSVFGELGLNNRGRLAARENRKVFRKPVHPLPRLAV